MLRLRVRQMRVTAFVEWLFVAARSIQTNFPALAAG